MTDTEIVRRVVRLHNMVPCARLSDPRTSKLAAVQVANYSDADAVKVLLFLLASEPFGMTADEIERKLNGKPMHQRLSDLKEHGLAHPTGETRATRWGKPAEVYRASSDVVQRVTGQAQGWLL